MRRTLFRQAPVGLAAALVVVIPMAMNAASSSGPTSGDRERLVSASEALEVDAADSSAFVVGLAWQNEFSELITSYSMDPEWRYAYSEIISPGEAVLAFGGAAPDSLEEELSALGGRVTVIERTGFTELEIQEAAGRGAQVLLDLGATSVLAIPDARDRTITVSFRGVALDSAELGRTQSAIEDEVLHGRLAAAGFSVNVEESEATVFEADDLARAE